MFLIHFILHYGKPALHKNLVIYSLDDKIRF